MSRSALVLGATGLVGGHCLQLLLQNEAYEKVTALVRKPFAWSHPKLTCSVIDFENLEHDAASIRARDVFCCLGTTIKQAGSQAAFRKVDFEYPARFARLVAANGAEQFLLVSALGANARSTIFYNRVKGEAENAIAALPFRVVHIMQPSLLLGERAETRRGEKIGEAVFKATAPIWVGPLRKYRPIAARAVAGAMIHLALQEQQGFFKYESHLIQEIADRLNL